MKNTPNALLEHKAARIQTTATFWAIKPETGDWQGYTALDVSFALPELHSTPGDTGAQAIIPPMVYRCARGVSPTAIPTRLDLSKQRGEVMLLAFNPDLLENGYYDGATFEAFEINYRGNKTERDVIVSGTLGRAQVSRNFAQVELQPWFEKATRATGNVCGLRCSVGRLAELPTEEFGTHRCAGEFCVPGFKAPNDGPKKANWTARGVITQVTDAARFRVRVDAQARSGGALPVGYVDHLEMGKVEFFGEGEGGANFLRKHDIKFAAPTAHQNGNGTRDEADIELNLALPTPPEIGAVLWMSAGCRGTWEDCTFYGNFAGANPDNPQGGNGYNAQFFHKVPGRTDALRSWTG
jgi:hypothetical protein